MPGLHSRHPHCETVCYGSYSMRRAAKPSPSQPLENPERLHRLKHVLQVATALAEVSEVFWEDVVRDPAFSSAGNPAESPRLRAIIERASQQILGRPHRPNAIMLIHMPEHAFWHGCFIVAGRLGQVFYFEDVDSGLLTLAGEVATGRTSFVRFSTVEVEIDGKSVPWGGVWRGTPSA